MYTIPLTLYDCLVMLILTALFVVQVVFTCAFERKPPVNRNKKPEMQPRKLLAADGQLPNDVVLAKEQNDAAVKPRLPPPPLPVCPEDTLHNVTSLPPDNETSMYFLSTSCSRTCAPTSYMDNHSLPTITARETPIMRDDTAVDPAK